MERPRIAGSNRIRAQQRRASSELTRGIEREIGHLHRLDAWKRTSEFAFFVALYALGATLALRVDGTFLLLPSILLMGLALNSLPIFIHEGLHGLLAGNERLNHALTFLVGLPILMSATAYQTTHHHHHYELGRKLDYGTYAQHVKSPALVWIAYFVQLMMGTVVYMVFIPILGFRAASERPRTVILAEYGIILAAAILVVALVPLRAILLYWFYPMLVVNVLTNLRGLASHALGDVENIYLSSRTVRCSRLVSHLFLRENYHLEHHLFPTMPSYHLPRAHELIWHRLPEALHPTSYAGFLRTFLRAAFRGTLEPETCSPRMSQRSPPRPRPSRFHANVTDASGSGGSCRRSSRPPRPRACHPPPPSGRRP